VTISTRYQDPLGGKVAANHGLS